MDDTQTNRSLITSSAIKDKQKQNKNKKQKEKQKKSKTKTKERERLDQTCTTPKCELHSNACQLRFDIRVKLDKVLEKLEREVAMVEKFKGLFTKIIDDNSSTVLYPY